jgi:hypothetical protein
MRIPVAVTLLISVGIVAVGVVLTGLEFRSTTWIDRAGSLVVLVGVISSLGSFFVEAGIRHRLTIQHRLTRIRVRRFYRNDQEARDHALQDLEQRFESKFDEARDNARLRFGLLEVMLITAGTLLWGFGDLISVDF